MTPTSGRMTAITLPDVWQSRTRDAFDDLFSFDGEAIDVDPAFLATLAADLGPMIDAAMAGGLVLLAGFVEPLDPVPVDLDGEDLEVPFSADDVGPTAIGASLALFEQPRPPGSVADLRIALDAVPARWVAASETVELPVGPAVVSREVQAVHPPVLEQASDVLVVTYYVLPTEEPDMLLVALFRTPSLGFASEFDEQFAAIAHTIEMVEVAVDPTAGG